jgi:hypothetical protein
MDTERVPFAIVRRFTTRRPPTGRSATRTQDASSIARRRMTSRSRGFGKKNDANELARSATGRPLISTPGRLEQWEVPRATSLPDCLLSVAVSAAWASHASADSSASAETTQDVVHCRAAGMMLHPFLGSLDRSRPSSFLRCSRCARFQLVVSRIFTPASARALPSTSTATSSCRM